MSKYIAVPVVSCHLVASESSYLLKIGDKIDSITVAGPYKETVYENATVVAISLDRRTSVNSFGKILDGIPTNQYHTDDKANIRSAEDYYIVDSIMVAMEDESTAIIPIDHITAITGTFETADGEQIVGTGVDGASSAIQGAADNGTVDIGSGEIPEAVTVSAGVTVLGENAGKAQNFKQEV